MLLALNKFRKHTTQKEGAEKDFRDGLCEPGGLFTALQQVLLIHYK